MKKLMNVVSALVLMLGLTASQASFAEFFPPAPVAFPPPMPMSAGCALCSIGPIPTVGMTHGIPGYGFYRPYGMYRHSWWGYSRGFLARGACGFPFRARHRFACGRGRRSFRSFSLNIGFGGFGLSINSIRF